ncbi:MAG: diacylglycerol kinase family protein [Nitrospirota bacterium]
MKSKMLIIANPAAGVNRASKIIPLVEEILKKKGIDYVLVITRCKGDETGIARKGIKNGFNMIAALGGDGTVNQVVNGIMGSGVTLGIIPAGTGSDLVKTLNIPVKVEDAVDVLLNGKEHLIDIGEIKGKTWGESRYFINIAGIGIDAVTVKELEYAKTIFKGKPAYFYALFRALKKYRGLTLKIKMKDINISVLAYLTAIANGRFFGGGFKITPDADTADGLFDICIVEKVGIIKTLLNLAKVIKGTHTKIREVRMFRSDKVIISSDCLMPVEIDGEIGEEDTEYFFKIHPKALKVMAT